MSQILYEMVIEDPNSEGVFAISLVDKPAIIEEFILLSKDDKMKIDLNLEQLKKGERRTITGPALIPGIIIPRKGYDITFSEETIRKISEGYIMNGHKDSITLQHQFAVNGVKLIESWIIEDANNDKSKALGFDLPKGTWMISLKVVNEDIWSEYIASGRLLGISIEGSFTNKEVQLEQEYDLDAEIIKVVELVKKKEELDLELGILDIIKDILTPDKKKEAARQAALNTYYVWRARAEYDENGNPIQCPSCEKFDGQVKKLSKWLNIAIPRLHTGQKFTEVNTKLSFVYNSPFELTAKTRPAFGTLCTKHCNCELEPLRSADTKRSIVAPTQPISKKTGVVYPPMPQSAKPQIIKKNPFKK
jgi:hypothetical protein